MVLTWRMMLQVALKNFAWTIARHCKISQMYVCVRRCNNAWLGPHGNFIADVHAVLITFAL